MRRLPIVLLLVTSAGLASGADAKAERLAEEPQKIHLTNEFLDVIVDLNVGAHVTSFKYSGFQNEDVVYGHQGDNGGLFKDLWTEEGWPGEFDKRVYEAEIVKAGPDEAIVRTWTRSTGEYRNQTHANVAGLQLERTFVLKRGRRDLTVRVAITNQAEVGKRPQYWIQNALDFDGARKNNTYWRPTRFAVDWIDVEWMNRNKTSEYGQWYTANLRAGWNGVTNQTLERGLIFLMDYNALEKVYNNPPANTIEWMYDPVAIPAGKAWETEVRLVPTEGFGAYTHGDAHVIGHFRADVTPAGLRVEHTIAAASAPLKEVVVETEVHGIRTPWSVKAEPQKADLLAYEPLRFPSAVRGIGAMPCVVRVTVHGTGPDGEKVETVYEDYVGGQAGKNQDLVTLEPLHEFTAPAKVRKYIKPDRIELKRNEKPRILFVRGLWAEFHGIDEALKQCGEVEVKDAWMKQSSFGEFISGFPVSYDELLAYDAIVLGNVGGSMIGDLGQEMLADYLKAGGGVLFLSGDRTYGQAHFTNPRFLDQLPVTFGEYGDYGRLAAPSALIAREKHGLLDGVQLGADQVVLYAHHLKANDKGVVVLSFENGEPAVIASVKGAPRVAVVSALPFGEAPAGKVLYFRNANWQKLMANTLKWLTGR